MHAWCKDKDIKVGRGSRQSRSHCDSGEVGESDEPCRFEGDAGDRGSIEHGQDATNVGGNVEDLKRIA